MPVVRVRPGPRRLVFLTIPGSLVLKHLSTVQAFRPGGPRPISSRQPKTRNVLACSTGRGDPSRGIACARKYADTRRLPTDSGGIDTYIRRASDEADSPPA